MVVNYNILDNKSCAEFEAEIKEVLEDSFRLIYATGNRDNTEYTSLNRVVQNLKVRIGKDILVDFYLKSYLPYFELLLEDPLPDNEILLEKYKDFKSWRNVFKDLHFFI
jgi:hypothetical protein